MLFNSVKKLLAREGYEFTTVADAGSLNGACIYLELGDNLDVGIWQHTKTTVGVRFNASNYYMRCSTAHQVLNVIQMMTDITNH